MRRFPVFVPARLLPWSILMSLIIWFYLLWIPFAVFYEIAARNIVPENHVEDILYAVTIGMLVLEMLINLNSGYYEGGVLVTKRQHIFRRYFGWHFLVDVVGLLAQLSYFVLHSPLYRLLFFVKVESLMRYHRSIEGELSTHAASTKAYGILRSVLIYYLFANTASCVFYFIDYQLYAEQGMYTMLELWLLQTGAMDLIIGWPLHVQYLYSMYWALITAATIGYGDITPKNVLEVFYVIVFFTPNILFYSYMINAAAGGLQQRTDAQNETMSKVTRIHLMLRDLDVQRGYQQLVRYYVRKGIEESDDTIYAKQIAAQLSHELQHELQLELHADTFGMFSELDAGLVVLLAELAVEESYFLNEVIQPGNAYIHLYSGRMLLRLHGVDSSEAEEALPIAEIEQRTTVNSFEFVTNQPNPLVSYITRQAVIIYRVDYDQLVNHSCFYKYRRKIGTLAISLQLNYSKHGIACLVCRKQHHMHECPLFVYSPKRSTARTTLRLPDPTSQKARHEKARELQFQRKNVRIRAAYLRKPAYRFVRFQESYSDDISRQ